MFISILPSCNLIGLKLYTSSYLSRVCYMYDTVLSTLQTLFHSIVIATQWNRYCCYFHFIKKKTEAFSIFPKLTQLVTGKGRIQIWWADSITVVILRRLFFKLVIPDRLQLQIIYATFISFISFWCLCCLCSRYVSLYGNTWLTASLWTYQNASFVNLELYEESYKEPNIWKKWFVMK